MRFGINLRGDLAKLDDAEIALRYEELVAAKEERIRQMLNVPGRKALHRISTSVFGRGPFHARIFYKMQAAVGFLALAAVEWPVAHLQDYLDDCELKDVRDELKRRVKQRKSALATS